MTALIKLVAFLTSCKMFFRLRNLPLERLLQEALIFSTLKEKWFHIVYFVNFTEPETHFVTLWSLLHIKNIKKV